MIIPGIKRPASTHTALNPSVASTFKTPAKKSERKNPQTAHKTGTKRVITLQKA